MRVENVGKKFCRDLKQSLWYGIKDVAGELNPFAGRDKGSGHNRTEELRAGEFWANQDISFELRRGECLGLIGRNGAGKTTLLKMLNGLIKPDTGTIEMRGRVGALIALGAGFNPILTGRENIYVNGSILGLGHAEVKSKIDEIIDFAEIREFIDSPVQSYSSGMQVRLGFAVATALSPDVLILDEVLAVGDAAFRNKCYRRITSMRESAAVIFVSHSMEQISRICDRVILLSKGSIASAGSAAEGVMAYEALNESGQQNEGSFLSIEPPIQSFNVIDLPAETVSCERLKFQIKINSCESIEDFSLRVLFYNSSGSVVADASFASIDFGKVVKTGENFWQIEFSSIPLKNGVYQLAFNLINRLGGVVVWSYKMHQIRVFGASSSAIADCQLPRSNWTSELS